MMKIYLFIVFVVLIEQHCDALNSVDKFTSLIQSEENFNGKLRAYIGTLRLEVDKLKTYVSSFGSIEINRKTLSQSASHPLDAYSAMKKLLVGGEDLQSMKKSILRQFSKFENFIDPFPGARDLDVSGAALVIMQYTYEQATHNLSEGIIWDDHHNKEFKSKLPITAKDCVHFGKMAMKLANYDIGIDWYKEALRKTTEEQHSETVNEIRKYLNETIQKDKKALEHFGPIEDNWGSNNMSLSLEALISKKATNQSFQLKLLQDQEDEEMYAHAEKLCRGERLLPDIMRKTLSCRLITNYQPYLLLRPLKVEELSGDPFIALFHDFLSNNEMSRIIELAGPMLKQSKMHNADISNIHTELYRTSENAWLDDVPGVEVVTKRIGMALGLNVAGDRASESYQVANYGFGGQYASHKDYFEETLEYDRIATFVAYLSDVDAGGATVFPRVGISVFPKKGSAVFWWNLYRNGTGDPNTHHAGCPVLHGSKWIANKWPYYGAQMLKAPCEAGPMEKFRGEFWSTGQRIG